MSQRERRRSENPRGYRVGELELYKIFLRGVSSGKEKIDPQKSTEKNEIKSHEKWRNSSDLIFQVMGFRFLKQIFHAKSEN